jgi:hypothetical protein
MLQQLNILLRYYKQAKAGHQLKWQESLQRKAIGFKTQVLDIWEEGQPLEGYTKCCIKARLRVKGKIVDRTMHTLLNGDTQVKKGDKIWIRYRPGYPGQVLVGF